MGYQFAHFYTYSGSGGREGKFKVSGCLGEAFRDDGYTKHLEKPDKNIGLVYGDRKGVENAIEAYQEGFKDPRGHKLRKDGKTLIAGVFSWPPGTTKEAFVTGNKELKSWLEKEYGSALRCILTHEDEPFLRGSHKGEIHYHSHFFVVPNTVQNMKELHPGLKAKADEREAGKGVLEQDKAYKFAMGDWQDKIHKELGVKLGFERARPEALREKRLSRREQKIIESTEEEAKNIKLQSDLKVANAESRANLIIQLAEKTAENKLKDNEEKLIDFNEEERKLEEREKNIEKREMAYRKALNEKLKWAKIDPPKLLESAKAFLERAGAQVIGIIDYAMKLEVKNNELKNKLNKQIEDQTNLNKKIGLALDRLDMKYGEENQFNEWKKIKYAQKNQQQQEPRQGHNR